MYLVDVHDEAQATVDVFPQATARYWPGLLDVLRMTPGNGEPWDADNPDSPIRTMAFGAAVAIYMILERDRVVHVLEVQWAG